MHLQGHEHQHERWCRWLARGVGGNQRLGWCGYRWHGRGGFRRYGGTSVCPDSGSLCASQQRECGKDTCGNDCGGCEGGQQCSAAGTCVFVTSYFDDQFSAFNGWTFDALSVSGAGFISDGSYLLVNSFGTGPDNSGPVAYRDLDPPIDMTTATVDLEYNEVMTKTSTGQGFYFQFVDKDGVPILTVGIGASAYDGFNDQGYLAACDGVADLYPCALLAIAGADQHLKMSDRSLAGKVALAGSGGSFTLSYNDVQQVAITLTKTTQATRIRLGAACWRSGACTADLDTSKLDWARLTASQ